MPRSPHYNSFSDLHPDVQKFLLEMRPKDIEELNAAVELSRMIKGAGRAMRWTWIALATFSAGLVYLTDGWRKLLAILKGS